MEKGGTRPYSSYSCDLSAQSCSNVNKFVWGKWGQMPRCIIYMLSWRCKCTVAANASPHPADFDLIFQFPSTVPPFFWSPAPQGKQWQKMALSAIRCHYSFTGRMCPADRNPSISCWITVRRWKTSSSLGCTCRLLWGSRIWNRGFISQGEGMMGQDVSAASSNRNEISFGAREVGGKQ